MVGFKRFSVLIIGLLLVVSVVFAQDSSTNQQNSGETNQENTEATNQVRPDTDVVEEEDEQAVAITNLTQEVKAFTYEIGPFTYKSYSVNAAAVQADLKRTATHTRD